MYLLGYDIGSSSVKVSLISAEDGALIASDFYPKKEMTITAKQPGWAEQDPAQWWDNLKKAHQAVMQKAEIKGEEIKAIGITWQMHGLVLIDKAQRVIRPAIIWCDSRAVEYGNRAFQAIGEQHCLTHALNSPGNFTASKLAWVKEHEPENYAATHQIMLPGDYITMRLSGEVGVTVEGLSEGILWDFKQNAPFKEVLDYFEFPEALIPPIHPIFGIQAAVSASAAAELGLKAGTPIAYRAGDQPNNAFSLNVLHPGEMAANAGTSGVVYGVADQLCHDPLSRVNLFAHVNHTPEQTRLGALLCINGTGILYAWLRRNILPEGISYETINGLAAESPIGAKGVSIIPFGNGAERMLENRTTNCSFHGIDFNRHSRSDLLRAALEGIAFSYKYGMEIMKSMGMQVELIRAGYANMFQSTLFTQTLADITGASIELFNSDGSVGAARGAGLGAGIYHSTDEALRTLEKRETISPNKDHETTYEALYSSWSKHLPTIKR